MFVTIEEFVNEWKKETEITERVMDALTDQSLEQSILPGYRTLGQIAWHLVQSINYMSALGLSFEGPSGGETAPQAASFIASEYRRISHSMVDAVQQQWTEASLKEGTIVHDVKWLNGASLRFLIMHQAHHRGQMTVLMRQSGILIPEVYGPTYEKWIEKGQEPLI
ncbi:DinB family protein [Brevibacillus sp. SYSU BS000544]|uniref:DinB family protein n=1 Tax=Brevibacillus sp. SYSU BS000544 TaxID=3416443 RepID=UPI003CE48EFE